MVAACIGCGAMSRPGSCELGCGPEERLDLVPAGEHDELVALAEACHAGARRLHDVVRSLTGAAPADPQAAYRDLQLRARAALRDQPASPALPEPAHVSTTWWCPGCGGVDAPQPCIGVCVWRRVEWVAAERYEEARERARRALDEERHLRSLLRRAATATPRPGQWERSWRALGEEVAALRAP